MRLASYLSALAADACAPWKRVTYAIALANVNQQTKRLQPASSDGPFVLCGIMTPGAPTYPATATLELKNGAKLYTDGPVRASAISLVGAGAVDAAAAVGSRDEWPAPIVIEQGGQLAIGLKMDGAATAGASQFLRAWGYHTSPDFARRIAQESGELYVGQLELDAFTAAIVKDKDTHEFPSDVAVERLWHEETPGTGGALTRLELRLDNEHLIQDPENAPGILAKYPADPRAIMAIGARRKQQLIADATSDGGGTLTTRILLRGTRIY